MFDNSFRPMVHERGRSPGAGSERNVPMSLAWGIGRRGEGHRGEGEAGGREEEEVSKGIQIPDGKCKERKKEAVFTDERLGMRE